MFRSSAAAVVALALVAGTASAKPVSSADAAQFQIGSATYDDVTGKLGKPATVTTNSDGTVEIAYASTSTHVKAASFVPVVGLFAGGATGKVSVLKFTFGPDHVLKSTTTADSAVDCHTFGGCHN